MSVYKLHKYLEHLPVVLGQNKIEEDPRDEEFRKKYKNGIPNINRIDDVKELIQHSKKIGLKTPKYY